MKNKLSKNVIFAKYFEPYDFTETMGCLAVKVEYTCGDCDMLTTKSTNSNVHQSYEFENDKEFYEFIEYLKANDVKKL